MVVDPEIPEMCVVVEFLMMVDTELPGVGVLMEAWVVVEVPEVGCDCCCGVMCDGG